MYNFDAVINNKLIKTEQRLEIINPQGLKVVGTVSALSPEQINEAFISARNAFATWKEVKMYDRIQIIKKFRNLIEAQKQMLGEIIANEVGKGISAAIVEVERTVEYIDYTIEEAIRMNPITMTGDGFNLSNHKHAIYSYVPKGVGVAISPFNYPINLAISKIAPALVMGNTIVFKPATQGSLTGAILGKLAIEAGLPAGVFNVVTGRGREIGDVIVTNKEIDFISFTGSVDVGKHLLEIASSKDVVLELGGKDPAIILDEDISVDTIKKITKGAFGFSGQRCTAIKRIITTDKIADKIVPIMIEEIKKLSVGAPMDDADITPLIDLKSADYVDGLIQDAVANGAKVLIGNKRKDNLIYPTLVDFVKPNTRLAVEEPFGPVLPIIRVNTIEEMIAEANNSNFGLQASIFTKDLLLATSIAQKIETGTVNINDISQRGPDAFPFMGIKDSGMGVQGIGETLKSVTRLKGLVINY
ncbi:aldehyde dehydrogenase family protein [Mesoplasma photuris]|uniref:aldehyde dehydrogenase family protein n=1 Tax=Mesoplasma photuris TaxID=217731 RepID=UPI0004E21393|nr:aldehyde dehydrogenase family protein [Mesoplasma photuris]